MSSRPPPSPTPTPTPTLTPASLPSSPGPRPPVGLSAADIERIAQGVIDRTLPKAEWTHAAHFAAAFWLVHSRGALAELEMPALIRRYNEATGVVNDDHGGYHETITLASLRTVARWLEARPGVDLATALAELLTGPHGRSDWLLRHWSRERLFSVAARRTWVGPDLEPLTSGQDLDR